MKSAKGFSLIELLVVIAVLGLIAAVSSSIVINIFRSADRTESVSEVRQNGDKIIQLLERDLKAAKEVCRGTFTGAGGSCSNSGAFVLSIRPSDGGNDTIWFCTALGIVYRRTVGMPAAINNTNSNTGVDVLNCNFSVTGSPGGSQLVTFTFDVRGAGRGSNASPFKVTVPFRTSVATRGQ